MLSRIYFETEDEIELVGLLSTPEIQTNKVVISIHGMQSNCFKKREDIIGNVINNCGVAYFAFNNRGHELMSYTRKTDGTKTLNGGSAHEDVLESYFDIKASIEKMMSIGYKEIYLQGHSLGCTKIIYTYNRLKKENYKNLNYIKGIILLSLVDIVECQKYDLGEKYLPMLEYAEQKEKENKVNELMPIECFEHPISVKTYLRYFKYNNEINFAKFGNEQYDFKEINNIEEPLFLRWADNDLLIQKVENLVRFLEEKIKNSNLDIGYIKNTDHGYTNKEKDLAEEIVKFLAK